MPSGLEPPEISLSRGMIPGGPATPTISPEGGYLGLPL